MEGFWGWEGAWGVGEGRENESESGAGGGGREDTVIDRASKV